MIKQIVCGKYEDGQPFKVDIERLIETRLIVQASSGGGKTYAIRKLIEEMYGKVQIIVLDIEGDFGSLREKYDFIVAGKNGDIQADPRYAEQLARKILELRTDLICDLYELKQWDRIRFVRVFLEAMVNAPKDLWHPVAVILDEAHIFAPEGVKSESASAVADMASRGRKRGFFLIPATQRPAKISKDVVAECQNKLIGLGNTDIDRDRGAKELGFSEKSKIITLRDLPPGQFYAVGPAFDRRGANLVQIGSVKTLHQKSGSGKTIIHTPEPTAKVRAQLAKLADLPREAEQEIQDLASMKKRIRELESELNKAKDSKITPEALHTSYSNGLHEGLKEVEGYKTLIAKAIESLKALEAIPDPSSVKKGSVIIPVPWPKRPSLEKQITKDVLAYTKPVSSEEEKNFGQCERKILGFLSTQPGKYFTKVQVGTLTGYRHSSGGFKNAISKLATAGLILRSNGGIALKSEVYGTIDHLIDQTTHTLEDWINKLGKCEREIYQYLLNNKTDCFSKQEIGVMTQYSPTSGGFKNAISKLSTLGLIIKVSEGRLRLNPEIQL